MFLVLPILDVIWIIIAANGFVFSYNVFGSSYIGYEARVLLKPRRSRTHSLLGTLL